LILKEKAGVVLKTSCEKDPWKPQSWSGMEKINQVILPVLVIIYTYSAHPEEAMKIKYLYDHSTKNEISYCPES
jgi:hypothetical protein